MPSFPMPLLGFPNERLYGGGLLEIKAGAKTFFVEEFYTHPGQYMVMTQPDKTHVYYDNLLLVYTHINNAIEEMENAEHRQADAGSGENVERHA